MVVVIDSVRTCAPMRALLSKWPIPGAYDEAQ